MVLNARDLGGGGTECTIVSQSGPPEGLEGQVGDRGAGSEVQVLQLWAELTEAVTRAAREGTHTHIHNFIQHYK